MAPDSENGVRRQKLSLHSDRLVLVEGRDEVNLFHALIQRRIPELATEIQVVDAGGKDRFPEKLRAIQVAAQTRTALRSIGIVRDADDNPGGAFQSVCDHLCNAGLSPPEHHAGFSGGEPAIGVFIVPDGVQPGAIETLCRRSIKGSETAQCVEQYLGCLDRHGALKSASRDKSFTHACLAAARDPVSRVGEGARQGAWDLESRAFDQLVTFLAASPGA